MYGLLVARGDSFITVRGAGKGMMRLGADEILWALERMTDKSVHDGECWMWTRYTRNGYGAISVRDSPVYLHALSFAIAHGPLPEGQEVRHSCDIRACWRPTHLLAGTRQDNVNDAWSRGRAVQPPRVTGLRQHLAWLTDIEVEEIRATYGKNGENQRTLAARFGCSNSTIWRLVNMKVRL